MTTEPPRASRSDVGDAAWAYNRWPTIGLYAGGGLGLLLCVLFRARWVVMIGGIVGGVVAGCVVGLILARAAYPGATGGPDDTAPPPKGGGEDASDPSP